MRSLTAENFNSPPDMQTLRTSLQSITAAEMQAAAAVKDRLAEMGPGIMPAQLRCVANSFPAFAWAMKLSKKPGDVATGYQHLSFLLGHVSMSRQCKALKIDLRDISPTSLACALTRFHDAGDDFVELFLACHRANFPGLAGAFLSSQKTNRRPEGNGALTMAAALISLTE